MTIPARCMVSTPVFAQELMLPASVKATDSPLSVSSIRSQAA